MDGSGGVERQKGISSSQKPKRNSCMFRGTFFGDQSSSPGVVHAVLTSNILCAQQSISKLHQEGTSACQAQAVD